MSGPHAEALYRIALLQRLHANPAIRIVDHTTLHSINGDHVVLAKGDNLIEQQAAAVLLAHGLVPDTELSNTLAGLDIPVIRIGDAAQVARIGEAVRDAYRAVQDIRRFIIQKEPIAC